SVLTSVVLPCSWTGIAMQLVRVRHASYTEGVRELQPRVGAPAPTLGKAWPTIQLRRRCWQTAALTVISPRSKISHGGHLTWLSHWHDSGLTSSSQRKIASHFSATNKFVLTCMRILLKC